MSISIQSDNVMGLSTPSAGRTDEVSQPASSPIVAPAKPGHRGADSVDISSLSQSLAAAGTAQDAQQASRVAHLTALYRSGSYSVDAGLVSHAIVSQALNAGGTENI